MSAANIGKNWTGEGTEKMAGCREKCGGSETAVDGGKGADVGIVKDIYCIHWLYHYCITDKHKAHISWAGGDHWNFFSSVVC